MRSCAFSLCACGRLFDSVNVWGHFLCSEEAEIPDGINDVGWSWVFGFFLNISCSAVPFQFARAGVLFDSVIFWGHLLCSVEAEKPVSTDDVGWSDVFRLFLNISCWAEMISERGVSMISMLLTISETREVQWCNWFCSKWTFSRGQTLSSRLRADSV